MYTLSQTITLSSWHEDELRSEQCEGRGVSGKYAANLALLDEGKRRRRRNTLRQVPK